MKKVPLAEFKAHCSRYVEEVADEEIVITKYGKPVAKLVQVEERPDLWAFLGALRGKVYVDPDGDLLSTGVQWNAEP
jgi:prevent-host-death family protein